MKLGVLFVYLAMVFMVVFSSQVKAEDIPEKHQRMGHHGMVMFAVNSEIYASHLPLYFTPHDFQIVYQVRSENKARLLALLAKDMVTILPAAFDLNRLVAGETFTLPTKIFTGHFERGGNLAFEDESFQFHKQLFQRSLTDVPNDLKTQQKSFFLFDTILPQSKLAIHRIQGAPSFDMIALVTNNRCETFVADSPNSLSITLSAPSILNKKTLLATLEDCTEVTSLYFETQDFAG